MLCQLFVSAEVERSYQNITRICLVYFSLQSHDKEWSVEKGRQTNDRAVDCLLVCLNTLSKHQLSLQASSPMKHYILFFMRLQENHYVSVLRYISSNGCASANFISCVCFSKNLIKQHPESTSHDTPQSPKKPQISTSTTDYILPLIGNQSAKKLWNVSNSICMYCKVDDVDEDFLPKHVLCTLPNRKRSKKARWEKRKETLKYPRMTEDSCASRRLTEHLQTP